MINKGKKASEIFEGENSSLRKTFEQAIAPTMNNEKKCVGNCPINNNMGWSIGYDNKWKRDIGYAVPAFCDCPKCGKKIDRGLAYVCGGEEPYGGEYGCGLYFCTEHKEFHHFRGNARGGEYCKRCIRHKPPYQPTHEHPEWIKWKLTDKSWKKWRKDNPDEVAWLTKIITPN